MKTKAKTKLCQKSTKDRVIAEASAMASRKGTSSWYDALCSEDKEWLNELKSEYSQGLYPRLDCAKLAKAVSQELGITVRGEAFRRWIRK